MAGRIRDESIAEVREKARIDDVVGQYVTLRNAGGGSQKGLCPFHDEKTPSFNVNPARGTFHCFGCQEGGDVFSFLQKIDGLTLRRVGRAAGREVRRRAQARGGRQLRGPPPRPGARQADRGQPGRPGVLRRAAADPGGPAGPAVPHGARLRRRGRRAVRRRVRAARGRGPAQAPPRARLQRGGVHRRRAGGPEPARRLRLRPLPRPAALADPRDVRRDDRLRRPPDLRGRPDRGEVPQHPRDHALQEEQGALRHRPGPQADGADVAGRGRRGLHRRDGLPPRRRRHRGRLVRHRVRRRPRQDPAPAHGRPRGVPRRGHLHLRRRRGRPGGGASRRSPATRTSSPRPTSPSSPTGSTRATCASSTATPRSAS